ncbi:MAG: TIGR03663 family protein [Chloroflexi bacterium]|nr:TIGR03663 family protein [Chloroflexota bacterium]
MSKPKANASPQKTSQETSWLDRPLSAWLNVRVEVLIFAVIVLLAIFTRFYHLGDRVMSHDESLHTYYSWLLYKGNGYQHNPMMHGPLQFHLIAFSFFLFGDTDFTARIPHATAAVLAIAFLWAWRRYLGRKGALIAAGLMLISPYMLYYGRYARNEALIMPLALVTLWAVLRYLETGATRYLTWLTVATALHFVSKETAFIYTAQLLFFLAWLLVDRLSRAEWPDWRARRSFYLSLMVAAGALAFAVIGAWIYGRLVPPAAPSPEAVGAAASAAKHSWLSNPVSLPLLVVALAALVAAVYFLITGYGWRHLLRERAFVLLLLLFSLVLPQLAPLPMAFFHWNALDYSSVGIVHTLIFLVPLTALAIALGVAWDARTWFFEAALFYGIFAVFQTTVFTNGGGFFSGLVGALGYWLEQQGVHRGSQPWYYYLLIQVPIYEYLPALGTLAAMGWMGWRALKGQHEAPGEPVSAARDWKAYEAQQYSHAPVFGLLAYWSVSSFLAYTLAGEKMPWLTVHITLPMILLTGWFLGKVADGVDWKDFARRRGWLLLVLVVTFILSTAQATGAWLGVPRPFSGSDLASLQATANFLVGSVVALLSAVGLAYLSTSWRTSDLLRLGVLTLFGFLALLTAHTAIQATYYNYDQANEYLVYAHSARGVKTVMSQVQEISERVTDGLAIQVAYDSDVSWPFTWYLRNYPNQKFYGSEPTQDLRDVPIIIVGDNDFAAIEPIVGRAYTRYDYIRMVWPNQDYFGLTRERIKHALTDPLMREALFRIWLNRDFTLYFQIRQGVVNTPQAADVNMANILADWQPSDRMRLYIRNDIVAKMWNYNAAPSGSLEADPYAKKQVVLRPDKVLGSAGSEPGQFQSPRGIAVAPDGSLYVADTRNFRIQHIAPDGQVLQVWGTYGNLMDGGPEAAPPGTFNEPWGVAVGPDGSVYVTDTWNHRIQKFTADGKFITMWGQFGNDGSPLSLWGPRDVVVDAQGRVYVTDTGNKRVVIFDADGAPLGQFGRAGSAVGEFNEPVGLALDAQGNLYVADTWNQRVQVFAVGPDLAIMPLRQWDIFGWFGQSTENKPYLAVDANGHVFVGDPEGYRVLEFDNTGSLLRWWGQWGAPPEGMGLVGGLAVDGHGGLWVADAEHGQILHFLLNQVAPASP